ncbi:extracellular solute-binding protein [Dactylosporangium vinaceum]|uniref:ABC transporter substrate-binding protein n=1 Tax=Dactylosporangium vinaceum TaxID=53362 RepID=A0ABV5MEM9_9ACTN|nr:extracellular solute-binding protein [Dactylosporangium vinaceum]UAB92348.1 extracellular solute-binding protein [Dactylosporangium vinaceum]
MSIYSRMVVLALAGALGTTALTACGDGKDDAEAGGATTIVVDCPPQKTDNGGKSLQLWNDDVAAFQKAHPGVTIKTVSVGSQCNNPPDFTARLQGGTQADLFYGYMTDLDQVLDADAAEDITKYITADTVPGWDKLLPAIKDPFIDNGKVYGLGYAGYGLGLVINKPLFKQAGLDPAKPPATWQEVAAAAKKISGLGNGVAGYQEYSAGNTGGWHFSAALYSRGGSVLSADGKKAAFNTPEGKAVLANLKSMRFSDNSVGEKQLLQWADLLTNAGAGKVGMYIGAPDTIKSIVTQFKGRYEDWSIGPMPGDNGPAKATLGGGSGYFFKKGLSAAQIRAGLQWITFEKLTPGQGDFNYAAQKGMGVPVGLPEPLIWKPGTDVQRQDDELKKANSNLDLSDYAPYASTPITVKAEPARAQAIYAVLDAAMSAVLTQPDANVDTLLSTAEQKVNTILSQES